MLYKRGSFTVPATSGGAKLCEQQHAMADRRGNCIRCGAAIVPQPEPTGAHPAVSIDMYAKPGVETYGRKGA